MANKTLNLLSNQETQDPCQRLCVIPCLTSNCVHSVCRFNNPLTDDELLDAIDDVPPPAVAEHLAVCPFCAERRDQMVQFEEQLIGAMAHPSRQTFLEYHFNLLDNAEMDAIGFHLDGCADCARILDEYARETQQALPTRPARADGSLV